MSSNVNFILTETTVIRVIAANLTALNSSAALSHYPSLRIQTRNMSTALLAAAEATRTILADMAIHLDDDSSVTEDIRTANTPLFYFRRIAPQMVRHFLIVVQKLLDNTAPEPMLSADDVMSGNAMPCGSFEDFCDLCTSVRQFTDALIETSYQLCRLDAKYLNYKVLESLASFVTVAPASLQTGLYSPELEYIVNEFMKLSAKERRRSPFIEAANEQFPQRVAFIVTTIPPAYHTNLIGNINAVYKFCSDFAHIGYVSTLVAGSPINEVLMGGPGDVFVPRSENFAELKWQLLRECVMFYADIFIGVFDRFTRRFLEPGLSAPIASRISETQKDLIKTLELTNRTLVEPIRKGIIGGDEVIEFRCNCGEIVHWIPPHHMWDCYCQMCGARFAMHEVEEDVEYVISSLGPGDITGGTATKIKDLPLSLHEKLMRISEKHRPKDEGSGDVQFLHITDLENTDEETLRHFVQITDVPAPEIRAQCRVFAFVSGNALRKRPNIAIHCNCGALVGYPTASDSLAVKCSACGTMIGLYIVSGKPTHITMHGPDGNLQRVPVHGSSAFPE